MSEGSTSEMKRLEMSLIVGGQCVHFSEVRYSTPTSYFVFVAERRQHDTPGEGQTVSDGARHSLRQRQSAHHFPAEAAIPLAP